MRSRAPCPPISNEKSKRVTATLPNGSELGRKTFNFYPLEWKLEHGNTISHITLKLDYTTRIIQQSKPQNISHFGDDVVDAIARRFQRFVLLRSRLVHEGHDTLDHVYFVRGQHRGQGLLGCKGIGHACQRHERILVQATNLVARRSTNYWFSSSSSCIFWKASSSSSSQHLKFSCRATRKQWSPFTANRDTIVLLRDVFAAIATNREGAGFGGLNLQ